MSDASGPRTNPAISANLLTLTGIAAAFGVAACCALPLLFASFGIGAAWLTGVALLAVPYRNALLVLSALTLAAGAVLLWRQQRFAMTCGHGTKCVPLSVRIINLIALVVGGVLLWAGYRYV